MIKNLGKKIRELHAHFHVEAARVLDLALKGEKEKAMGLLDVKARFSELSGKLTLLLAEWKKNI